MAYHFQSRVTGCHVSPTQVEPMIQNDSAIAVFTFRSYEQMLSEGGSFAWVLDKARAEACRYVLCVRNRNNPDEPPQGDEPHSHIFMIAEIDGLERFQGTRWLIRFKNARRITPRPINWKWRDKKYGTLKSFGLSQKALVADYIKYDSKAPKRGRNSDSGAAVTSYRDGHSAHPRHAPIVEALKVFLEGNGWKLVLRKTDVCADLFVTKDGREALFEVKPDDSPASFYSGIGQLLIYAPATGCKRKILIAPGIPRYLESYFNTILTFAEVQFLKFVQAGDNIQFPLLLEFLSFNDRRK